MSESIHVFVNASIKDEYIILPESRVVEGYNYNDYINGENKAQQPDTFAPLNQDCHTQ